jgi:hypothetical protein
MRPKFCTLLAASAMSLAASAADLDNACDEKAWHDFVTSPNWSEPASANPPEIYAPKTATGVGPIVPAARQPMGALSGRVVFMNSGHGWTWYTNLTPNAWNLQRPTALNSMNEDYGNWDQLNFFAAYCFNAGAIIAPMRPLGQQTNEIILDNTNATFAGAWTDSTSTVYFGRPGAVAYRFASFANTETATATYTPTIPAAGFYPVYTWVRHGTDRGDQLYRIRHTGGESGLRIPHYLVGNGWVYLGEYYFNAASNAAIGSVVVSNLRATTNGSVVIADAIRFGNGLGSIDRGGGVSGYPREEESCRYWVQANLGQGQSASLYSSGGTDEQDSWHAPPRMSVEMSDTNSGYFFRRIHISFHSNATTGNPVTATTRGVNGLITGNNTPNQPVLAQLCGQTVNDELSSLNSPPLEYTWHNRGTNITFSGGYSEISNTDFVNTMDATIIEVAYHDNTNDAALMADAKVRAAIARAAMHAVVKYFNQFDTNNPPPLVFLPEPPANVRAIGDSGGNIALAWAVPVSVANSGAPTNYIIYQSTNGYGFGNAISAGNVTNFVITSVMPGVDYYFRVSAANAGGESFPSEVVGCCTSSNGAAKVLFVNAFDRFDRPLDLKQDLVPQHYVPPGNSGGNNRVLPRRINSFDYVVPHGQSLSAACVAFDSCQHIAVTNGLTALTNYPIVIWACGNQSTADLCFSPAEETNLTAFLAAGGNLFTSGAEIGYYLDRSSGPSKADRNFMHNQLHAYFVADNSGQWNFGAAGNSIFAFTRAGAFDNGSNGVYAVRYPDLIAPTNGAVSAVNYTNITSGAAGVTYDGSSGGGRVVYLGFPFETILNAGVRNAYMADVLNFFGANPLRLDPPELLPGSQVRLGVHGPTGALTLQTGSVLGDWSPLLNFTNASGAVTLTNPVAAGAQFFRVKNYP